MSDPDPLGALRQQPHRRWNPLARRWVLVSPHRTQRPWQGQMESSASGPEIHYDPQCYLCPGNTRANGETNPAYASTFVFENDFAALKPEGWNSDSGMHEEDLLVAVPEAGICRVLCYSPDHALTMARMSVPQILHVVDLWRTQYNELAAVPWIRHVQIFENRGAMMGASNPHPHGQLWANQTVPDEAAAEAEAQDAYFALHGRSLLSRYAEMEAAGQERIVCENEHFLAVVPFWAVWPFETLVVPRRHYGSIAEQTKREDLALAAILRELTIRYDNLFLTAFPYSAGLHQRPVNDGEHPGWHFHLHFYPPLLRSATVRKFVVGYELLAGPQRDITPETAAERLRALPTTHYLEG